MGRLFKLLNLQTVSDKTNVLLSNLQQIFPKVLLCQARNMIPFKNL